MKLQRFLFAVIGASLFFSCVSPKKLKEAESKYTQLNGAYLELQGKLRDCDQNARDSSSAYKHREAGYQAEINSLNGQVDFLKKNNTQVLDQLKDLSVISGSQAESIKKSLENIGAKDAYIQDLQSALARKDSLNMRLVMNLKGAIGDMNDQDINIKVDKSAVYIDISDKMLFKSGKYEVTDQAKMVLGKVAKVLTNQPDIEFMVEGHTDTNPIHNNCIDDNWDLSVKRATSVVRILQKDYGVPPERMTAAGRGEYISIATNETAEGRSTNRRTRIVILPQLDQFFKLLEPQQ